MGLIIQQLEKKPIVSTNTNNGSQAGTFTLNVNNPSSNSNVNKSSRLAFHLYDVSKSVIISPRPLTKERTIPFSVGRLTLEDSGKRLEI